MIRLASRAVVALLFIAWAAAAFATDLVAIPSDERGLPQWQIRQWDDTPVSIALVDHAAVSQLLARVPLSNFSRENLKPVAAGWRLETRITAAEARALNTAGIAYTTLPDLEKAGRRAAEAEWARRAQAEPRPQDAAAKSDAAALDYYPTHAEIGTLLSAMAYKYPAICRTFSWGQTVQGRELWGLVVSADVNNTTAEPEVRLSSTMHGNEVVGMVMLVDLAHHLTDNYGKPGYDDLTSLVDNTEIHIMPLHNPDGYVAGGRYNANSIDLNRNFPLPTGTHPSREIENVNFMAYANAHNFVISQNGHGGALVANYPWDHTLTLAPDDAAMINLSLEYSTYNSPMFNGSFSQGITNGADWYRVDGGLQDWSYDQTGCIDVTMELSNTKWPAAATLTGFWDDNRESLMHFIAASHYGVNGTVVDAVTGDPVAATVSVTGNSMSVGTDPDHGDFYKLLDSGTYELTFVAEGYDVKQVSGVSTTWGTPTTLAVQMTPTGAPVPGSGPLHLLVNAWPNPFNPVTKLTVEVAASGPMKLEVYDLRGRLVRTLLDQDLGRGTHTTQWDGQNDQGVVVPSGVYFARASNATGATSAKLMLVK